MDTPAFLLQCIALAALYYGVTTIESKAALRGQKGEDGLGSMGGRIMRVVFLFVFTWPLLYIIPAYIYVPIFVVYGHSFASLKELCLDEESLKYEMWEGKALWIRAIGQRFNCKLVKTVELPTSKQYILGIHPHGILPFGAGTAIFTNFCGVKEKFPGLQYNILTASVCYMVPGYRELVLSLGGRDASRYVARRILGYGKSVVVVPGGAAEALLSSPEVDIVHLKDRYGFIKLAIQSGASLVPVFAFNECNTFNVVSPRMSFLRNLQRKIQMVLGMSVPILTNLWPNKANITTVVGAPLSVKKKENPSREEIDAVLQQYIRRLRELYTEHGPKYNTPSSKRLEVQ